MTRNLGVALQSLRSRGLSELLWADALCINQNDLAERSQQVQVMQTAYQSACVVFAWLGEAAGDSNFLMHVIETTGKGGSDPELDSQVGRQVPTSEGDPNHFDLRSREALSKLMARPYWERVWITQELATAGPKAISIGCGQFWLSWWYLFDIVLRPFRREGVVLLTTNFHRHFIASANIMFDFQESPLELLELLERSKAFSVTDPHDRLYAILGLAKEHHRIALAPDYSKQLSAELVKASDRNWGESGSPTCLPH